MQISIIQAILIGTLYYLTNNGVPWLTGLGSVSIRQPICAGTIVGLILGKPVEGCIMGATINTLYLGFVNAGGTLPTDPGIGGVVGDSTCAECQCHTTGCYVDCSSAWSHGNDGMDASSNGEHLFCTPDGQVCSYR